MANEKKNIAIVFGGISSEHDISIQTGIPIMNALDREKYSVKPILIGKSGLWHISDFLDTSTRFDKTLVEKLKEQTPGVKLDKALSNLYENDIQLVYIALHGKGGEDGTLQAMLEFAGISYTGSGVLASSLAMDKARTQELFEFHGILMPAFIKFNERDLAYIKEKVSKEIGFPCVLKPVDGGSSAATFILNDDKGLADKVSEAYKITDQIMFQKFVKGDEVSCGVMDTDKGSMALPPTQIIPKSSTFFDLKAKYEKGGSEEITPARLPENIIKKIQELALKAHKILGCAGLSRTDIIVCNENELYVLETNTAPGMTPTSLYPQQAAVIGIDFPALQEHIIKHGLQTKRGLS